MCWMHLLFVSFVTVISVTIGCQPANDGGQFAAVRRFCAKYSLSYFSFVPTLQKLNDNDTDAGFRKAIQYDLLRLMVLKGLNAQAFSSKVQCFRGSNPLDLQISKIQPVLFVRGNTTMERFRQTLIEYSYMALPDNTWYKIESDNINVIEVQQDDTNCCGTVFP